MRSRHNAEKQAEQQALVADGNLGEEAMLTRTEALNTELSGLQSALMVAMGKMMGEANLTDEQLLEATRLMVTRACFR